MVGQETGVERLRRYASHAKMNRNLLLAGGVILAAFAFYYIHSTSNRFYMATSSEGRSYRIDKKTGRTWLLRGLTMSEVEQPEPEKPPVALRSLPYDEFCKFDGNAGLSSFGSYFEGELYNGSTWYARELVVEITAREADGETRWTRLYKTEVSIAPLTTGSFHISVNGARGADLSWNVEDIRGYPQSEHDEK